MSLAAREIGGRLAVDSGSFARRASNLSRAAGIEISDEKLRQLVESEGRAVIAWQEDDQLELDFDAGAWKTDGAESGRAYVGIDGFLLPVVTDAEAAKRFDNAVAVRKKAKRRKGVRREKLKRHAGADNRYKEIKQAVIYDQDKDHRLVRATCGGVDKAGKMLRQMADDVHLNRAGQIVAVTDGAEWIAGLIKSDLPPKTTAILDWYHASEHRHAARRALFGESGPDGAAWADRLLETIKTRPFQDLWELLADTRAKIRSPVKRQAVDGLMQYPARRKEKVDYPRFKAAGLDIGSGPTESMCKSLSRRLKGIGMRWTVSNAESLVALEALHQSGLWRIYWSSRLAA